MARTLEVAYIANTSSLERGNALAATSTETTTARMVASHKHAESSYFSMAGAGARAAAQLEGSHSKIASSLTAIGRSGTVAVAGVVALGAAVEGTKRSVATLASIANETRTLHNVTGLSIQSASAYAAVAKAQELPVKALNQAFGTLSKNIHAVENAHSGATKAARTQENALKQLGLPLSVITHAHGDLNKILPQITERFEHLPGSVNKAAIGMALFGRGWQTLVPLMHAGALGLKEQLDVAQKMGATLSGTSSQQLKEFAKQEEESKYASLGLQLAIGQYLAPALTDLIHWVAGAAHELKEGVHWLKEHETAAKALAGVIAGALSLAFAVFVSSKAKLFIAATKDMIGGIRALAATFGLMPKAAATAGVETAAAQDALAADVAAADVKIGTANAAAGKSFLKMLGPIAAVVLAIEGLNKILPKGERPENLLGGNQPGEAEQEGSGPGMKFGRKSDSNTAGGIMAYFMSKGLTAAQAAGIVGNIQQESSLNPNAPGGGLFQDIGPRAASGRGSVKQQIEAAWHELATSERATLEALKRAKTPQQAARIFSERFERPGEPMLSNRERYAREAYNAHPQGHHTKAQEQHTKAMEQHSKSLGYYETPAAKAKRTAGGTTHAAAKARAISEGYVEPFSSASGLVRGREDQGIDFTARPGSKVGAIGAGVIDKIISNWFKGQPLIEERLTSGPHKGQYVYYAEQINSAVREGQRVRAGQAIGTVARSGTGLELGFGAGGGRTLAQATTGYTEGQKTPAAEAFSKFLSSVGKSGSNIEIAGNVFKKTAAAAEHFILTAAQRMGLHGHVQAAGEAHAEAMGYGGAASSIGSFLQARQSKWAREKPDLTTTAGQGTAHARDEQAVLTAQTQKKYYERELKALQREAREWVKIRDSYRKFARHAKGPGAKKEALHKAAEFDAKVKGAQKEAGELGGSIATAEAAIEEAQQTLNVALPEEIAQAAEAQAQAFATAQQNDLSAYQGANSKVDAEVRAGLLTEDQGKAAKIANANKALAGGFGGLSDEGRLQVLGDLKEFATALTSATAAVEAHTQAMLESTKQLLEREQIARGLAEVENGTLIKAMSDLISGQIGGVDMAGRRATAGAGTAARY